MNSIKNNDYIDLLDIAKRLWLYKFPIIALAVLLAMLNVVRVELTVEEKYVSRGMFYVSNQRVTGEEQELEEVNVNDIDTAKSLSATYREVLKTRSFLKEVEAEVANRLNGEKKYSWSQIKGMLSLAAVNETELMQISVMANSSADSLVIAECVMEIAPVKLEQIFGNGTVKVVDEAAYTGVVGKGTVGAAAKGGVLGAFIAVAIVVIIGLFDTKVRKSEDVAKKYNISILGEIAQ